MVNGAQISHVPDDVTVSPLIWYQVGIICAEITDLAQISGNAAARIAGSNHCQFQKPEGLNRL
jgi:hypothetical protein